MGQLAGPFGPERGGRIRLIRWFGLAGRPVSITAGFTRPRPAARCGPRSRCNDRCPGGRGPGARAKDHSRRRWALDRGPTAGEKIVVGEAWFWPACVWPLL